MKSFFSVNTFPLQQVIIVEDGPKIAEELKSRFCNHPIVWISTGKRVGQIAAIDYAYSRVRTPYIFHMEDDWEFFRSGFIEKSMRILEAERSCLQVWLRSTNDTNDHPLEPETHFSGDVPWRKLAIGFAKGRWNGFSFNPGLRRLADYVKTNGYGNIKEFNFSSPWDSEISISQFYRDMGMYAAILCDSGGIGYVRHIGEGRETLSPDQPSA